MLKSPKFTTLEPHSASPNWLPALDEPQQPPNHGRAIPWIQPPPDNYAPSHVPAQPLIMSPHPPMTPRRRRIPRRLNPPCCSVMRTPIGPAAVALLFSADALPALLPRSRRANHSMDIRSPLRSAGRRVGCCWPQVPHETDAVAVVCVISLVCFSSPAGVYLCKSMYPVSPAVAPRSPSPLLLVVDVPLLHARTQSAGRHIRGLCQRHHEAVASFSFSPST